MQVNEPTVSGLNLALTDGGTRHLIEATAAGHQLLAQAKGLEGPESSAPMAFADGRLLARDLHRMVCLDMAGCGPTTRSAR